MKKTLAFFVFLSIFSGCAHNPSSVKIIFTNQSDNLTHLTISNGTDSVQLTAKENNSETKDLRFERVPKTDGHYHIHIKTIGKDTHSIGDIIQMATRSKNQSTLFIKRTLLF